MDIDTLTDLYAIPSPEQLDIRKASIISTDSTDERHDFFPVGLKQKEVCLKPCKHFIYIPCWRNFSLFNEA